MLTFLVLLCAGIGAVATSATAGGPSTAIAGHRAMTTADGRHFTGVCPTRPAPGQVTCDLLTQTTAPGIHPDSPGSHSGVGPDDIHHWYNLPNRRAPNLVAIIEAYDNPNAESDLATYRADYSLPSCTTANHCFTKVNQLGQTSPLPARSPSGTGAATESSADIEIVSAVCPYCHILVVEATNQDVGSMYQAVDTAVGWGARIVSMSFSTDSDQGLDQHFKRTGVAFVASTGDDGYGVAYPAGSPYVVAVGGTSMYCDISWGLGCHEYGWSGSGSGCAASGVQPLWQYYDGVAGIAGPTGCAHKAVADVSAAASPDGLTPLIYATYQGPGWTAIGGTSVAAPVIAGVFGLADPPNPNDYVAAYPWGHPSALNDVTAGLSDGSESSNGTCPVRSWCHVGVGWDGMTGLGSPNGLKAFSPNPCTDPQLVVDPSFESGPGHSWLGSSNDLVTHVSPGWAHSGTWLGYLGDWGTTHTDTLSQLIKIPSTCTSAKLSFWLKMATSDAPIAAYDNLTLTVEPQYDLTREMARYSNLDAPQNSDWHQYTLDLSYYAGQMVDVLFTANEDYSLATWWDIDDMTLTVS